MRESPRTPVSWNLTFFRACQRDYECGLPRRHCCVPASLCVLASTLSEAQGKAHDTDDMFGNGRLFFAFSRQKSDNPYALCTPWLDGDGFEWVAELEVLGWSLSHTCHRRGRPDSD